MVSLLISGSRSGRSGSTWPPRSVGTIQSKNLHSSSRCSSSRVSRRPASSERVHQRVWQFEIGVFHDQQLVAALVVEGVEHGMGLPQVQPAPRPEEGHDRGPAADRREPVEAADVALQVQDTSGQIAEVRRVEGHDVRQRRGVVETVGGRIPAPRCGFVRGTPSSRGSFACSRPPVVQSSRQPRGRVRELSQPPAIIEHKFSRSPPWCAAVWSRDRPWATSSVSCGRG